jgi:hypothetical protein
MHTLDELISMPYERRKQVFVQLVAQTHEIWILADDDGAVMLVAEDEDCIPVWPSKESAQVWQNSEWQYCEPRCIALADWHERWTNGMLDDDLCVVIFPVPGESALTTYPDEFDMILKSQST